MKIELEIKPFSKMRYPTLGDYYYTAEGVLKFEIADTGNDFYNKMILIHEFIEQALLENRGVAIKTIDDFDFMFEEERTKGIHSENDEPGFDLRSPYQAEHTLATSVEMQMCAFAGIAWKQYEDDLLNI